MPRTPGGRPGCQRPMARAGRMAERRAVLAQRRAEGNLLGGVDESLGGPAAAGQRKRDQRAEPVAELPHRQGVIGMIGQSRIVHRLKPAAGPVTR